MRLFHLCSHRLSAVAWWIFPIFQSNHLLLRCFYSHPKGSAEINVLHCIKCDLPRGTFDWLKHGICGFFPCRRMKAHSNENSKQIQNTYLYQQSVEHLYLYIFSPMYVLLFFLSSYLWLCFSFMYGDLFLCILSIIIFISAAHLIERSCRESGIAGGND